MSIPITCDLCRKVEMLPEFYWKLGEPYTCPRCQRQHNLRIKVAHAEKAKTLGNVLKDGLYGPDDKSKNFTVDGIRGPRKARPVIKAGYVPWESARIDGKPRTGRIQV